MSFEEQYDSGRYGAAPPPSQRYEGGQPAFGFAPAGEAAFGPSGATTAAARPPTATAVPSGPYMRVVRASYGAGTKLIDVTATLQQLIFNKGGLTLDAFGYTTLRPNGCMNALFGDPAPGEDKQLLFSFEVVGTPKLLTKPEDIKKRVVAMMVTMVVTMGRAQMTLTMDHLYTKTTGKSSPPEEVKLFCADIVKASYGLENRVYDVTTTLRIMLSEQGGKGLRAFGYTLKPNGCMNKAFGDPAPGKDKILTVEYLWRTPVLAYAIDEDKKVSLNFEALRPLL